MPNPAEETLQPLYTLKIILRTLPVLWRAEPLRTSLLSAILVVQGLLPAAALYLTKWTIDEVAALTGGASQVPILTLAGLWTAVLLLDPVLSTVNQLLQSSVAERFTAFVNLNLMKKVETLTGLDVLEDPKFYNDLKLLQEGARSRPLNLVVLLLFNVRDSLTILSLMAVLFTLGWWVPLVLLLATLPHTIATLRLRNLGFQALISNSADARAMEYDSRVALSHAFAQEVRLFNLFAWLRRRYEARFLDTHRRMRKVRRKEAFQVLPISFISTIVSAGLFTWAVWQASRGVFSAGQVVIMIQALAQVQFMARDLVTNFGFLYERARYFDVYLNFLKLRSNVRQSDSPQSVPLKPSHSITFEDVTFHYPDGRLALQNVSFHIPTGETVALVGENGAGKTTLVKLLLRFYEPSSGRILIDGIDLRELDLPAWRAQVGAVFQNFNRFDYTIRENVAIANLQYEHDTQRITEALRQADLDAVVNALEQGQETRLGKEFGGTELSGGQWQKLAMARAMFRDASVLILDEPTAALDPRSEHALYAHFAALAKQPTTFLITHRLPSVLMADRVLVLKEGHLVEDGTHGSLLRSGGEYAELWGMQAKQYSAGILEGV